MLEASGCAVLNPCLALYKEPFTLLVVDLCLAACQPCNTDRLGYKQVACSFHKLVLCYISQIQGLKERLVWVMISPEPVRSDNWEI